MRSRIYIPYIRVERFQTARIKLLFSWCCELSTRVFLSNLMVYFISFEKINGLYHSPPCEALKTMSIDKQSQFIHMTIGIMAIGQF